MAKPLPSGTLLKHSLKHQCLRNSVELGISLLGSASGPSTMFDSVSIYECECKTNNIIYSHCLLHLLSIHMALHGQFLLQLVIAFYYLLTWLHMANFCCNLSLHTDTAIKQMIHGT